MTESSKAPNAEAGAVDPASSVGAQNSSSLSSSLVLSSSSLRTLVDKWRREAAAEQRVSFCADELAALLSPVAVEEKDEDTHTRTGEASTATDGAATASTEGEG